MGYPAALRHGRFVLLFGRGLDGTLSGNSMIEVEVGGGDTGNEARSAAESHVLDGPLNENQDAALELDDVCEVNKSPYQPGRQAPKMYAENVGHRGCTSDDCNISFVEVIERCWLWFTFYFPNDRLRGVGPSLHGYLGHTLQGLPMFVDRESHIADNIDVGKIGNGQIRADLDPSATISFRTGTLRQRSGKWGYGYASGPYDGFCGQRLRGAIGLIAYSVLSELMHHRAHPGLHSQFCE